MKFFSIQTKELIMKKYIYLALTCVFVLMAGCGGPKVVTISPVGNEMKYDVTSFTVKAGQTVRLVMDNKATLPIMKHNVVILRNQDAVDRVGQEALTAEDHLPIDEAIIAATPIADAGQVTEVEFTAPEKAGQYPYICTFPGHYMVMRGVMIVE